jgi:chromosome partitioning protein
MTIQQTTPKRAARVIVVGNEKGGSGKSTVAMNIAVALMKAGRRVATIDLDTQQKSLTRYIENRRAWSQRITRDLETPEHVCLDDRLDGAAADDADAKGRALIDTVDALAETHEFIVIDTPGHDDDLTRLAHTTADTLVTPLNDSFVDFDLLATVDPESFHIAGTGPYGRMVEAARGPGGHFDWIVLRNRLTAVRSHNKRLVGEGLNELSQRLDFRCVEGLTERVIFREFFPRGLTAIDDLDAATLGTRPTMSHASARFEVEALLNAMGLGEAVASGDRRDAA